MKPLSLEMQNFGPYLQETVDFSLLHEVPLFLISGKTGSGKTTLFDAMCFALYGATSGGLRQGKEMRSNFADASIPTEVIFNFEHKNKTYRIKRLPEQWLRKKRSDELKKQTAKVCLTRFSDTGEEEAEWTKQKEVSQKIEELLHLNVNQFCQIVLLPQGQFRRFLNANSNEREAVLRKLFQTEKYGWFAERLKEKKKQFAKELDDTQQSLSFLFERIHWDDEFQKQIADEERLAEKIVLMEQQQIKYASVLEKQQTALTEKEQEKNQFAAVLQKKQLLVDYYQDLQKVTDQKADLEVEMRVVPTLQQEIEQLRYLKEIKKDWDSYHENVDELSHLRAESKQTANELVQQKEQQRQFVALQKTQQVVAKEYEQKKEKLQIMKQMSPLIKELQEKQLQQKDLEESTVVVSEQLQTCEQQRVLLQEQLKPLELQKKETPLLKMEQQTRERQLEQQKQVEKELLTWVETSQIYQQTRQQMQEQQIVLEQLIEQQQQQQKELAKAKHDFAKAQILYLQQDLLEGEPCPVCGSLDHPIRHEIPDTEFAQVGDLEKRVNAFEKELSQLGEQRVRLEENIVYLQKELSQIEERWDIEAQQLFNHTDSIGPIDESTPFLRQRQEDQALKIQQEQQQLLELSKTIKKYELADEQAEQLLQEIAAIEQEQTKWVQKIQLIKEENLQLRAQIEQLTKQTSSIFDSTQERTIEHDLAKLEQEIQDWEKECSECQQNIDEITKVVTTTEARIAQKNEQIDKQQQRQDQIKQSLIEYVEHAPQLVKWEQLTEVFERLSHLTEMEEKVNQYKLQYQMLQQQEQQLQQKIAGQPLPDVSMEQEKLASLEQEINRKIQEHSQLKQIYEQNQMLQLDISHTYKQQKEQQDELVEWIELSNVANGDGKESHISLERYVLQTYLDEVLFVANERLLKLSQNRYRFELKEDEAKYKTKAGLELNIFDENVGSARSVHTLSGGESFIAALSLSLALAEVIQMQAGGVQIDAMFIDEGFGSLDDESLEMAMEALESIEQNGRMIGIISHVKELKERVLYQLQVVGDGTGKSHIQMQTV